MSQNIERFRCPFCGSTDITYNTSDQTITCNQCKIKCSMVEYQTSGEVASSGSVVAGTLPPKPVIQTEEVGFRRITQGIFPHTHEEIRKLESDITELKNRVNQIDTNVKELMSATSKVVVIEEIPREEAKRRIIDFLDDYMKEHEHVYPSDVADELGLKYELVREIFDTLEKEGKLQKKVG